MYAADLPILKLTVTHVEDAIVDPHRQQRLQVVVPVVPMLHAAGLPMGGMRLGTGDICYFLILGSTKYDHICKHLVRASRSRWLSTQ